MRAEAAGFKAYERTGIKLDSNDTVRIDAVLEVGQVSESVTVAADVGEGRVGFERSQRSGVRHGNSGPGD